MKTLKLCLSIVLLLAIVSCKKKDEPVPDDAKIDLTKYFITWEDPIRFSSGIIYNIPALITFENDGKATLYGFSSGSPVPSTYKFEEDKITLVTGGSNLVFNIKDETIISTSGFTFEVKNIRLHKAPATNQFVGKYSGILYARQLNTAIPYKYVFNQTQFGEEIIDDPTLDYVISPIKNVYATSIIDNVKRHFLILDGKLMVVRMKFGGTNAEAFMYGVFSKYE